MKNYNYRYRIATDGQLFYLQKRYVVFSFVFWRTILTDTNEDVVFNHINAK